MEDRIKTNIVIDEAGGRQVLLTFSIFKKLAVAYLVWAVLHFVYMTLFYWPHFQKPYHLWTNIYFYRVVPALSFIHILLGLNIYFLNYKAYSIQKNALETGNSELYVTAYKLFRKSLHIEIVIMGIITMTTLFSLFYYHSTILN